MKLILGISLSAMILLAGCSGLTESDCVTLDWTQIGLEDGQNGRDVSDIDRYQECSKHGVQVDMDEYDKGYAEGLKTFCRADNGFEAGESGYQYSGICPDDLEADFLQEYNIGAQFYYVRRDINAIENAIAGNQDAMDKLEIGISTNNIKLADDELEVREEAILEQDIRSMESQIAEYQRKSPQLLAALLERQKQLEGLKKLYGR